MTNIERLAALVAAHAKYAADTERAVAESLEKIERARKLFEQEAKNHGRNPDGTSLPF